MRIDKIHEFILDMLRKEQKGYVDPEQIDTAINLGGQYRVFNHYLPQYAFNNEAKEALAPFLKKIAYATNADGTYSIPAIEKFQGLVGMGIQYLESGNTRQQPVTFPTEDEFDSRLDSQLLKPTITKPVAEVTGSGSYQLHPAGVYAGIIRFLRQPAEARFAYTQVGRAITYDDANSVQLEWAEKYQSKIILGALSYLGIPMSDDRIIQISEALSKLN